MDVYEIEGKGSLMSTLIRLKLISGLRLLDANGKETFVMFNM